ncbi:MAG: MmcB family DNA repair protein [Pseudomonadota bacterium]
MDSRLLHDLVGLARDPLRDGRQSDNALEIQRGVCRHFAACDHAPLCEFSLPNGRRADVFLLGSKNEIAIVEIKSSIADFRVDRKWPEYIADCDRFYFAVAPDFPIDILPRDTGLIIADRFGAEIVRDAPENKLNAARRKSLTLRFARHAALRLQQIADPGPSLE